MRLCVRREALWTALIVFTAACARAPREQATDSSELSRAAAIESSVALIEEQLPRYRAYARDLTGLSSEGGRLEAFGSEGVATGGIRKLVVTHFGETGRTRQSFYFVADSVRALILARNDREYYDQRLSGVLQRRANETFYFWNGTLLHVRDTSGGLHTSADPDVRARAAELTEELPDLYRCASGLPAPPCAP